MLYITQKRYIIFFRMQFQKCMFPRATFARENDACEESRTTLDSHISDLFFQLNCN